MSRLYESADSFIKRKNSQKTKAAYQRALLLFGQAKFSDTPDDEMFNKLNAYIKKANLQMAIDDIYLYKEYLNGKNLALRSTRLYIAAIQSWFANNGLKIPKNNSKEIRGHIKPITDDKAFTHETAKKTFDQMKSPVSRGFFLFLLSTGCRLGEALTVKLSDINWNTQPVTVTLDEKTTKTGESRQVFLTSEAAEFIKIIWLTPSEEEGKNLTNRERFIIAAENKARGLISAGYAGERPSLENEKRLWPFGTAAAHKFISTAIIRAGFNEKTKTGTLKLHPHSTRKFFRTVFGMAAGPDAAETLLGHSPGLTAAYRKLESPELIRVWNENEVALHINISSAARQAMQTREQHAAAIAELQERNKKLEENVNTLLKFIDFLGDHKITFEKMNLPATPSSTA